VVDTLNMFVFEIRPMMAVITDGLS